MKRVLITIALIGALVQGANSQTVSGTANKKPQLYVGTEAINGSVKYFASTSDSVTATAIAYLEAISFTSPVANDTITVKDGTTTIAQFKWGTAPNAFAMPFFCNITSGLFVTTKASTGVMISYRASY